jgi:hypothetical protein
MSAHSHFLQTQIQAQGHSDQCIALQDGPRTTLKPFIHRHFQLHLLKLVISARTPISPDIRRWPASASSGREGMGFAGHSRNLPAPAAVSNFGGHSTAIECLTEVRGPLRVVEERAPDLSDCSRREVLPPSGDSVLTVLTTKTRDQKHVAKVGTARSIRHTCKGTRSPAARSKDPAACSFPSDPFSTQLCGSGFLGPIGS